MPKPLLFIDINGVLLNRARMTEPIPGRKELLDFMFDKFDVVSWTSVNEYKLKGDKKIPHGTSRVKHAFGDKRKDLTLELYADSCHNTGEVVHCDGYTKPKLTKSLEHLKAISNAAKELLAAAPWILMIDDSAYKIDCNDDAEQLIIDLNEHESKEASMVFCKQRIERLVHKQIDSNVPDSGVGVREHDETPAVKRQRVSTPPD